MTIDQSLRALRLYKDQVSRFLEIDMSESDTRSKVIDNILIKVLGWEETDIKREGYSEAGFYDYKVAANNFNFVVEAKRNFNQIKLPTNHKTATLNTLYKGNKDVIDQIRGYALEEGLQFGVITNGRQFIVSKLVNVDNTKWKNNKCVIFDGLDSIEDRFVEFYNLLAKNSVKEQGGFYYQSESSQIGNKIINYLNDRHEELIRNSLSSSLIPIIERVFGEMFKYSDLDDRELIEQCYVHNEEVKKNRSDIERLFGDLPPAYEEVIPIRNTKNQISQIGSDITDYPTTINDTPPPSPIVIIGSRGAGKTTFLNYLFKVGLTSVELQNHPNIYLDFRNYSDHSLTDRTELIYKGLIDSIYEKYADMQLYSMKVLKRVFRQEIKYNDSGIWEYVRENNPDEYNRKLAQFLEDKTKDPEQHFVKLSEYLIRERRKRLTIIVDNVDQFDIGVQKKAYIFAHSINRKARCAVLISLREGYYYKFRHETPFNAYESHVYHVTAAPYSTVLLRRINYAIGKLSNIDQAKGTISKGSDNKDVLSLLLALKSVLFESENSQMLSFLEKTTYPDLREGLLLFKKFLLSGHAKVDRYVDRQIQNVDTRYSIPIWEFITAIALENKKYYDHDKSIVKNIFHPAPTNTSHFTKIKILRYLLNTKSMNSKSDKYVLLDDALSVFSNLGVSRKIFIDELTELINWGMIETESAVEDTESENIFKEISSQSLTISLKGYYYISTLKNKFHYIDLVLQDTPIYDANVYKLVAHNFPKADDSGKRSLKSRSMVVRQFHQYLVEKEKVEHNGDYDIFKGITQEMYEDGLKDDFKSVAASIKNKK